MILKFITFGIIFYIGICAFMFFRQERFIFPSHFAPASPKGEFIPFKTADGVTLETQIYKSEDESAPVILLFTGNAQNALSVAPIVFNALHEKFTIATMNYRSYGKSEGKPSAKALESDATAFANHIEEQFKGRAVYLMGISLGTGVASAVAPNLNRRPAAGIILTVPFDSMANVAKGAYPFLPVHFLIKHHFDNVSNLAKTPSPIAILRAGNDEVIPAKFTQNLSENINNLVFDYTFENMAHTEYLGVGHKDLFGKKLLEAINALNTFHHLKIVR